VFHAPSNAYVPRRRRLRSPRPHSVPLRLDGTRVPLWEDQRITVQRNATVDPIGLPKSAGSFQRNADERISCRIGFRSSPLTEENTGSVTDCVASSRNRENTLSFPPTRKTHESSSYRKAARMFFLG
jgi:hypothetical protein